MNHPNQTLCIFPCPLPSLFGNRPLHYPSSSSSLTRRRSFSSTSITPSPSLLLFSSPTCLILRRIFSSSIAHLFRLNVFLEAFQEYHQQTQPHQTTPPSPTKKQSSSSSSSLFTPIASLPSLLPQCLNRPELFATLFLQLLPQLCVSIFHFAHPLHMTFFLLFSDTHQLHPTNEHHHGGNVVFEVAVLVTPLISTGLTLAIIACI